MRKYLQKDFLIYLVKKYTTAPLVITFLIFGWFTYKFVVEVIIPHTGGLLNLQALKILSVAVVVWLGPFIFGYFHGRTQAYKETNEKMMQALNKLTEQELKKRQAKKLDETDAQGEA